jgi:hypothetical protein
VPGAIAPVSSCDIDFRNRSALDPEAAPPGDTDGLEPQLLVEVDRPTVARAKGLGGAGLGLKPAAEAGAQHPGGAKPVMALNDESSGAGAGGRVDAHGGDDDPSLLLRPQGRSQHRHTADQPAEVGRPDAGERTGDVGRHTWQAGLAWAWCGTRKQPSNAGRTEPEDDAVLRPPLVRDPGQLEQVAGGEAGVLQDVAGHARVDARRVQRRSHLAGHGPEVVSVDNAL